MCSPVAAGIISGVGMLAQISAQNRQAQAEVKAANQAAYSDYMALQDRQLQLFQKNTIDSFERQRQEARKRARLAVASGEANLSGHSPMRLLYQNMLDTQYDIGLHRYNYEAQRQQTQLQSQKVWATQQSRINMANAKKVNPFLGALQIGSSVASGYYGAPRIY